MSVSFQNVRLTKAEIQEKVVCKAVGAVQEIVEDNAQRMSKFQSSIAQLGSGVFYGNQYFNCLESTGNKARLDFFLKKGAFYHGWAPSTHFEFFPQPISPNHPTGVVAGHFLLKKGAVPSNGLAEIRKGLSFLDCGAVCQTGFYAGLEEVFGVEKFNVLFSGTNALVVGMDNPLNPLLGLVKSCPVTQTIEKGQMVFFTNIANYGVKHMNGDAGGYHSLCCDATAGSQKFTTLGLASKGLTKTEIAQKLLDEYNATPIGMKIVTEDVAKRILASLDLETIQVSEHVKGLQLNMETFTHAGGGKIAQIIALDMDKVHTLALARIPEAQKLLTQWNAPFKQAAGR